MKFISLQICEKISVLFHKIHHQKYLSYSKKWIKFFIMNGVHQICLVLVRSDEKKWPISREKIKNFRRIFSVILYFVCIRLLFILLNKAQVYFMAKIVLQFFLKIMLWTLIVSSLKYHLHHSYIYDYVLTVIYIVQFSH